jgi:plastocyanin
VVDYDRRSPAASGRCTQPEERRGTLVVVGGLDLLRSQPADRVCKTGRGADTYKLVGSKNAATVRAAGKEMVFVGFRGALFGCVCVFLLLGTLAACGGGGSAGNSSGGSKGSKAATGPVVKTIEVKETEYKLTPEKITLNKPGTYVLKARNSGSTTHALEIEGKGVEEETEDLGAGQSAELKVALKRGRYEIYCPVDGHKEQGMEGTVTVKGDSGGGSRGY